MRPSNRTLLIGAAALIGAACAESATGPLDTQSLFDAFSTAPIGYESASSSYAGTGTPMAPPGSADANRGPGADFMGGGLGPDFSGGLPGVPPFEVKGGTANCTFDAASGVVSCPAVTRDGLTIVRTFIFKNAAGTVQSKRDSTTESVVEHTEVSGTVKAHHDSVTHTVKHVSDRTVVGVSKGSTKRTMNGVSSGSESTAGTSKDGAFTASRTIADTTQGLVTPVVSGKPSYPTAGVVIRTMSATRTVNDGSATAKLVITENGKTRNCTLPLPHGKPACS